MKKIVRVVSKSKLNTKGEVVKSKPPKKGVMDALFQLFMGINIVLSALFMFLLLFLISWLCISFVISTHFIR